MLEKKIVFLCVFLSAICRGSSSLVSEEEIRDIYTQYVKPNALVEYKNRYVPLPFEKNVGPWRWEGKDFSRVISLLEFDRFVESNRVSSKKALSINGPFDPEWHYLLTEKVVQINYDIDPQMYDLHTLDLSEKDFDFVMVNQTLEHVYDPIHCLKNIYKHMAPGGILYLSVPAVNILHTTPFHYYTGFTPVGLGVITKLAGFEIMSIGQWGNIEYIKNMYESNDWPDYRQLKNPGFNDSNCPVITWIFARK